MTATEAVPDHTFWYYHVTPHITRTIDSRTQDLNPYRHKFRRKTVIIDTGNLLREMERFVEKGSVSRLFRISSFVRVISQRYKLCY